MQNRDQQVVRQLVQNLSEGTEIYRRALEVSQHPGNQAKFRCMIKSRTAAVEYLQPYTELEENAAEPVHAFGSALHKMYPEILADLERRLEAQLIEQLERVERDTLQQMQRALEAVSSPPLKSVILDLHPKLPCTTGARLTLVQAC